MAELLTDAELRRLTGATTPEAQKQVLTENGIPYVRRKNGSPALTWTMVNQSKLTNMKAPGGIPRGLNLEALNEP